MCCCSNTDCCTWTKNNLKKMTYILPSLTRTLQRCRSNSVTNSPDFPSMLTLLFNFCRRPLPMNFTNDVLRRIYLCLFRDCCCGKIKSFTYYFFFFFCCYCVLHAKRSVNSRVSENNRSY